MSYTQTKELEKLLKVLNFPFAGAETLPRQDTSNKYITTSVIQRGVRTTTTSW